MKDVKRYALLPLGLYFVIITSLTFTGQYIYMVAMENAAWMPKRPGNGLECGADSKTVLIRVEWGRC